MDFWGNPKEQTVKLNEGKCDFCRQWSNSRKPLLCKRHFYCRVCEDFSPKFIRKDFKCSTCSSVTRKSNEESLRRVDNFFAMNMGAKKKDPFKEITIAIDANNIITFNDEPDEPDEDDDLSGNNEEWESMYAELTKDKNSSDTNNTQSRLIQDGGPVEKIPRNMSTIKLVMPSAESSKPNSGTNIGAGKPPGKTITDEKLDKSQESKHVQNETGGKGTKALEEISSCETEVPNKASAESFEEERGSSPVKEAFKKMRHGWISAISTTSEGTTDEWANEMYNTVEGPGFHGDFDWNSSDDYEWDF